MWRQVVVASSLPALLVLPLAILHNLPWRGPGPAAESSVA